MSKYFKTKPRPAIILICDVSKGRGLQCKDAIGGLLNIYFVNEKDAAFKDATVYDPATELVSGVTLKDGSVPVTPPNAYKYELHLGNNLTQNMNPSAENGTFWVAQVLNLTLKRLSAEDNVELRQIAIGRPYVLVEDQMENIWLVGRLNGADAISGTALTGQNFGDLNGYTLALQGNERTFANSYTGDIATDFTIVVDPVPAP
jgi:hypothetical protein